MNKLKPCPFCGGKTVKRYFLGIKIPICEDCYATMLPDEFPTTDEDDEIFERQAVNKWNRRAEE